MFMLCLLKVCKTIVCLQVITINGMFPGPLINATTNDVVHVNVFNNMDEPLLITWYITCLQKLIHSRS